MWRLFFLALFIYLIIVIFKRINAKPNSEDNNDTSAKEQSSVDPQDDNADAENAQVENMVQCAACAVHLPRSEAFMVEGDFYCSKAHLPK